jgi:hypothetical protein
MPLSSLYAPFSPDVENHHRRSVRHRYSAIAHPRYGDAFELDVEEADVTFDSAWSPYIQASVTCKVIEDAALLAALDPRNGCRVTIYMGYVYDGFIDDVHPLADLHVRERRVNRPANTITLTLASDEALAEDYKRLAWGPHASTVGLNEFVTSHAGFSVVPGPVTVVSDFPEKHGAAELADMVQDVGQDSLSMIADAAERLDARVYVDGDRTWRIARKAEISGVAALKLFSGPEGTIFDSEAILTRGRDAGSGFHNAVTLKYLWKDSAGNDKRMFGNAVISSGPYATATVGYMGLYEEREYPVSQATANAAAANVLRSKARRGHQATLAAHAAYWLRPGHTVTLQLPSGAQERWLVRQVRFTPSTGTMTLALNQPINVTISTTSG